MLEETTIDQEQSHLFRRQRASFASAERMGQRETNRNGHHDQPQHGRYRQL